MQVARLVDRGDASWSNLPAAAQRDLDAAMSEWQRAADEGFAEAQCNLGLMFEYGRGVVESDEKAAVWLKKSADQGHAKAQHNLGI